MKNRVVKRLLAGCMAAMLLFGDTAGILASELSETELVEVSEATEIVEATESAEDTEREETMETAASMDAEDMTIEQEQRVVTSEEVGPVYMAYFGLPSALAPKQTASEASEWQGDRIINFGYRDGQTFDTGSYTDTWKILDPSAGVLWADGIFMRNSASDMDTMNEELDTYLNKTADNNAEAAKYDTVEKAAMREMRLLTKAELMTEAYGFQNTEEAVAARKIGDGGYHYSYPFNNDGTVAWVGTDGSFGGYGNNQGYAPAIVLNTDKVFMTVYSDFYEYGGYAKTDISDTTSRSWNLLLHSGDTGFAATLPETAPHDGYYDVDVTGLGSLAYDKISMLFVDSEGDIAAYVNSSYNEDTYDSDTYLSKPTEGSFQFSLPTDLAVGTYTVKVFCENEDGAYDTGYVSNIVEGTVEVQGPMASNISVEQIYGQVNLYWEIANKRTELFQTYTYCNIYRSVSRNGEYELVAANVPCDNSDDSYYWMDRSVSKLEDSVENATYYYRIVTLSDSAECGGTEMVSSDVVTNEGLFYGVTGLKSYIGAYIVNADGEKISALTIHEGETLELGLALVKPDGTTEDVNSKEMAEGIWYLHKEYSKTGECQNQEEVVADKLEICPYELVLEDGKIVLPAHKVYLQAGEDAEGVYYLTTEIKLQNGAVFDWQIPVTIIAAEEGIDYEKCPDIIVQTKEEAEQKLRDFMVARDNESYVVVAPEVSLDKDTIFDIYAEREGMKPNEGDYLNYQVGYKDQTSFFWHPYESTRVEFNRHSYSAYYSTTPFITTAEEEAEVDAKINALVHTEGGALYEAAHGNTTDEEKIKAIYDWIIANVNPNVSGDRTTPIYHTVYHTLFGEYGGYPGSGTCGAFAVLFTRLTREMGIASKVIMGTDAAAHAYNIVKLGQKWYFIDTNSRRYLSDADEFERAQEQAHYLDQRFIDNYLSKIPGSDYEVESVGKAVVTNSLTSDRAEYEELAAAVAYIKEEAAKAGNEAVEYTLTITDGDMACPAGGLNFIDEGDRVTIDLGGYTLIVRDALNGGAGIRAKYVHNGSIAIGDDVSVVLAGAIGEIDSLYENVDIVYESTIGTADHTGYLYIAGGDKNKLILADSVTIDKFFVISVEDNAEVNTNLSATHIELGTQMDNGAITVINGKVTAEKSCMLWGGNVEVEELISKVETQFKNIVATTLTVGKEITLGGMTAGDYGAEEPAKVIIELERHFASVGDTVPTEQAVFNWEGNVFNIYYNYENGSKPFPMFHIIAKDYVNGVLQENKAFSLGQTIGTVDVKGKGAEGPYNIPVTSANLSDYLTVEAETSEKVFVEIADKVLKVSTYAAELSYADETGTEIVSSFKTFADAVNEINALKTKRAYTITLYEDCAVSAAWTMPNKIYVSSLTIIGAGISGVSKISSNGKLALTSDTVLKNILLQGASIYAVSIGDFDLTIAENVDFAEKVSFTSGKKGSLIVTEAAMLGNVTSLNVGTFINAGDVTAETVKITDAYFENGHLTSSGSTQIANLTLDGKTVIQAEKEFKVTGTLYSKTNEAVLYSKANAKGVPYLNISGTVTLETPEDKIQVGVLDPVSNACVKLDSGSMLLNVKTATVDKFAPAPENVGYVGAYPAECGYFLQKNKNGIYVYYGDEASAALYLDDTLLGYFASFAETVAEIEARKDMNAEYTIALLKDINSKSAPAGVTLPSKAAYVTITGWNGQMFDMFYTGNLTLKTHTEFLNVRFSPMNKNGQGAASKIAAGKFDLTLRGVEVGNASGMMIKDITGSKTQVTTLDTDGLVVGGAISGSKELVIERPVTVEGAVKVTKLTLGNGTSESVSDKNVLKVTSAVTVTELEMQGYAVLEAAGTVSVTDIYNNKTENIAGTQANAIYYTQSSKGTSNLTVKGTIIGDNETALALHYDVPNANKTDYQLKMKSGKFTLNNKQALAAMEKAALSEVTFYLGANLLGEQEVVKANKAVYMVDASSNPNVVYLESNCDGMRTASYCLDYAQAVNEINNSGNADAEYVIHIGLLQNTDLTDTNTTDNKAVSALAMPKKGKAASVVILSDEGERMIFSGNLAFAGRLVINNVVLEPEKDCSISGTKNVSTVTFINTEAVLKDIKNVKELLLAGTALKTTGTVSAADVKLSGASTWDALGKTAITNLDVSECTKDSYVASKQTAKTLVPMFTINGQVTLNETGEPVAWKVYTPETTVDNIVEVAEYKNVSLVVAPKEAADRFVAYPFTVLLDEETAVGTVIEGMTAENLISYKTIKNEVACGDKTEMVIRIVQTHEGRTGVAETYAKSFDEAVTIIDNLGDITASYRMELLQGSMSEPLLTTKNGTAFGKMTLPKKAVEVTITSAEGHSQSVIAYKGSLAANCDVVFDDIVLLENGEVQKVTISYGGAYEMTFTDRASTMPGEDMLNVMSVKISKGTLVLDNADMCVAGAMTVKDLAVDGESLLLSAAKTSVTNIYGTPDGITADELRVVYLFSTKNKTQLTVSGNIEDVKVGFVPFVYNAEIEEYEIATVENLAGKQIVAMPKASIKDVTIQYEAGAFNWQVLTGGNLYKQNGGLYFGVETPVVEVTAEDNTGKEVYGSRFLSWEEAVKEIDKRADASLCYNMLVTEDIGSPVTVDGPIKTLTLPSKAKEVLVTSERGEENQIFFLGTKINLKANTAFENVKLSAVKKDAAGSYNEVAYTFGGSGKVALTLVLNTKGEKDLYNIDKISGIGTVDIYNAERDDAIVANQVQSFLEVANGMSGIGTLYVYPGATVTCTNGSIAAKNADICGGTIQAKDITISQTLTLEQGTVKAGSEALTDGKLKLKDIVVEDVYNYLEAQVDKNGKSQLNITGTVTPSKYYNAIEGVAPITVALAAGDGSGFVQLAEDMIVINAAKAEAVWFAPFYTYLDDDTSQIVKGMGNFREGFGLYNAGKTIKYGSVGL